MPNHSVCNTSKITGDQNIMANTTTDLPSDHTGEANQLEFLMRRFLQKHSFITLAQVIEVNSNINPPTLTLKPLILGYTGAGEKLDSGTLYNVPIFRLQRGNSAIVMDPEKGDIGLVAICDADISGIKNTKKESMPASSRKHSLSDSIYLGGVLNSTPTQSITFLNNGISISSPGSVTINGLEILPDGRLKLVDGAIVDEHTHTGVEKGSDTTSPLSP